jgi:glutamate 5-kinase
VVQRQTSLLPVGVTRVEGTFHIGDTVDLVDPTGRVIARGLVGYDSVDLIPLVGRRLDGTTSTARSRTASPARTVVRRDDLVVL